MKKVFATVLSLVLLCGCSSTANSSYGGSESGVFAPAESESGGDYSIAEESCPIVFVMRRTNYAWGKRDSGSFIDMNGDMYSFDFSDRDILAADFVSALVDVRESSKPSKTGVASKGKLAEIVSEDIPDINTEAKVSAKNVMCDYGQETLYVVGTDGSSMIMLRSEGDWEQKLQDNTAKALCSYFDREILKTQVQFALERLFDSVFGGVRCPDTLLPLS